MRLFLLTCWSWRISSLRSSTRLWSSRLSWESRSVPSSAFSDSLVDSMAWRLASRLWRLRCWRGRRGRKIQTSVDSTDRLWAGNRLNPSCRSRKTMKDFQFSQALVSLKSDFVVQIMTLWQHQYMITLGMKVFSDCCLFSFSIFISDRILSLEALNFLCCVSICCIWFISWSISLLMRRGSD